MQDTKCEQQEKGGVTLLAHPPTPHAHVQTDYEGMSVLVDAHKNPK